MAKIHQKLWKSTTLALITSKIVSGQHMLQRNITERSKTERVKLTSLYYCRHSGYLVNYLIYYPADKLHDVKFFQQHWDFTYCALSMVHPVSWSWNALIFFHNKIPSDSFSFILDLAEQSPALWHDGQSWSKRMPLIGWTGYIHSSLAHLCELFDQTLYCLFSTEWKTKNASDWLNWLLTQQLCTSVWTIWPNTSMFVFHRMELFAGKHSSRMTFHQA